MVAVPELGGSMWDELMGLVGDPTPIEPTDEPQAIKVGSIAEDGSYSPRPREDVDDEAWRRVLETTRHGDEFQEHVTYKNARASLEAMGFEIVEDKPTTLFEQLGGYIAD